MSTRLSILSALFAISALAGTGCQAIHSGAEPQKGLAQAAIGSGATVPTIMVEVRSGYSQKSRTKQLALTEPLSVQQLLAKTGTLSRFSRMNITIERPVAGQRLPLKLNIPFDPAAHSVAAGHDYAVLPGDKIVIAEDKRTIVDRVLDEALDAMGPLRAIAE